MAALIAVFAVGEGAARLAIWLRSGDPMYGAVHATLDYAPFLMTAAEPSAYGFRPLRPGVARVLWCGSSTAQQFSPDELAAAFRRVFNSDVEVVNVAQPGHNSSQELVLLALHGMQLRPDLIVTLDGINDVAYATRTGRAGVPTVGLVLEQAVNFPTKFWLSRLFARSQLVNSALRLAERRREIAAQRSTALVDDVVHLYGANTLKTAQVAKGLGARHLTILQPCLYSRRNPPVPEKALSRNVAYRRGFLADVMRRFDAEVRSLDLPENASYLNGLTAFDDQDGVMFGDESHLTPEGRRVLLERVVAALRGGASLRSGERPQAVAADALR